MIAYAVIQFSMALLFAGIAIAIYKGKTGLIHDYHQRRVRDLEAYGKAFGKAMGVMAGTMALSAGIALLGEYRGFMWAAVGVLFFGFGVGTVAIILVQKKYNGGVF